LSRSFMNDLGHGQERSDNGNGEGQKW